jgi:hypothetical protein
LTGQILQAGTCQKEEAMKLVHLVAFAALFGSGPGVLPEVRATELPAYTYETALRERFDDPTSVEFKNVRQAADGRAYCGEVNGRDRHGQFVGFRQFLVYGSHGAFMVLIAESDARRDGLNCD